MKLQALCRRTTWEIVRDPLNLAFGLGFPLVLLLLLSAIQANVPVDLFAIERLTPGISVFGLAFIALFSATLVARDRESALLQRLYTAPLTAGDFIFGYVLPLAPMAAVQAAVCYLAAIPLGLTVSVRMIWAVLLDLPAALLFIGLGLLCGSVMNVKQVGGICGALLTNLTAWLSGTWFDLELVGGAFQRIAYALPFVHAVELDRAALSGDWASVMPHLWWVLAYAAAALAAAVLLVAGLVPKFSSVLTTIPQSVIGGATVSVFAMITMTGIRMITSQKFTMRSSTVVGLSVALGMGVTQVSGSLAGPGFPGWVTTVFGSSSVVLATMMAIFLNLILPKAHRVEAVIEEAAQKAERETQ